MVITTARFSKEARRYAEGLLGQTVVLADGPALAGLMIDYGVGVSTRQVYEIKAVDTDFFEEWRASGYLAPFRPLHFEQSTCRLDGTVLPPLATGTIWSMCNPTPSGMYFPHIWQV